VTTLPRVERTLLRDTAYEVQIWQSLADLADDLSPR
jgi:hypothetical protein